MEAALLIIRLLFVITTGSMFYQISIIVFGAPPFDKINIISILVGVFFAVGIIWAEIKYATRFLVSIFSVIFGLLVGFIASYLFIQSLFSIPHIKLLRNSLSADKFIRIEEAIKVGITFFFCYLSVAIVFKTQNKFKLLIPFVELDKENRERHLILDSSVIIDGRIGNIYETNILKGIIVIPNFILKEIQKIADSSDKQKRARGRRGLEILAELQNRYKDQINIHPEIFPKIPENDSKLIALSQSLNGIIITNDYNLKKIAELQNIEVINLNMLANALRPSVLPGELMTINIVKHGEEVNQGIGYLADGTVVIVEEGKNYIGSTIDVIITNVLQTNIGRMVFSKPLK